MTQRRELADGTENPAAADEIMSEEPGQVHGPSHAREAVEWLTAARCCSSA
jgi:hypothetical protein